MYMAQHPSADKIEGVVFKDAWPHRLHTTFGDQTIWVIGRDHLIANKRAAGWPQNLLDLEFRPSNFQAGL